MKSVKGMTWGTPEFIEKVKAAEGKSRASEIIEEFERLTEELIDGNYELTYENKRDLRYIRNDLNELTGDYACYGECGDI